MTTKTTPERFVDKDGTEIVKVPLGRSGKFALTNAADYDRLQREGVTGAWFLNGNGTGRDYVRAMLSRTSGLKARQISVARALMGLSDRKVVKCRNGDLTDLRRGNLRAASGRALRCDIALARKVIRANEFADS